MPDSIPWAPERALEGLKDPEVRVALKNIPCLKQAESEDVKSNPVFRYANEDRNIKDT